MKVLYEKSFERDIAKVKDKSVLKKADEIIEAVKNAKNIKEIKRCTKLSGHDKYYRIEIGHYRIGLEIEKDIVIFTRFLSRKDIYRYFPA